MDDFKRRNGSLTELNNKHKLENEELKQRVHELGENAKSLNESRRQSIDEFKRREKENVMEIKRLKTQRVYELSENVKSKK